MREQQKHKEKIQKSFRYQFVSNVKVTTRQRHWTIRIIGYVVEDRAFDVANAYEDIEEFMKENKL